MNKDAIDKADKQLTDTFIQSLRDGGGTLVEADGALNSASRKMVIAMRDVHGEAWLGQINVYGYKKSIEKGVPLPMLWKWNEGDIYNFSADFVIPKYDEKLDQMVRDWNEIGASADKHNSIYDRIKELGGHHLFWS